MKSKSKELLVRYALSRDVRDNLRSLRDLCLCERHEGISPEWELRSGTPCWKAARHRLFNPVTERYEFYLDPPKSQWCDTCQRRELHSERLPEAVRSHAAAKRAILMRGRALVRRSKTSAPVGREDRTRP